MLKNMRQDSTAMRTANAPTSRPSWKKRKIKDNNTFRSCVKVISENVKTEHNMSV